MSTSRISCNICGISAVYGPRLGDAEQMTCPRCSEFTITGTGANDLRLNPLDGAQVAAISGYLREHPRTTLTYDKLKELRNLGIPDPRKKAMKLLRHIYSLNSNPGAIVTLSLTDPTLLSVAWAALPDELRWLLIDSLHGGYGFIKATQNGDSIQCVITLTGMAELKKPLGF